MNDQTDQESRSGPSPGPAGQCPLCLASLPDTTVAVRSVGAATNFTPCGRCHGLIPWADLDERSEPLPDAIEEVRRRVAEANSAQAPNLAWAMAEHLDAPGQTETIVDLAVGRGAILSALSRLGYSVTGCEPSAFLCQMARAAHLLGPDVLTNTGPDDLLDRLEAESGPISAFVLWHLLDRHPDPVGLLRRCLDLAPGGRVFIGFPPASAELTLPEQRVSATPRMLVHLADEVQATIVSASVVEAGDLSLVLAAPDRTVVDLDRPPEHHIDLDAIDRAYRAASPVFEALSPGDDDEDRPGSLANVEPADARGGR